MMCSWYVYGNNEMMNMAGGNLKPSRRNEMEPDARTDRDLRDVVQRRNADSKCTTDRTNNGTTKQVWQD